MNLQKRLAARLLKVSPKKIRLDPERLEDIKESITKLDIRGLISTKAITKSKKPGPSRSRARKKALQRVKGRQRGHGSRKGTQKTRVKKKQTWIFKIRKQRALIKELKQGEKITAEVYRTLYKKCSGGFFRSVRHIKLYVNEKGLWK
jgi:large subunit ribosomal protein L19e